MELGLAQTSKSLAGEVWISGLFNFHGRDGSENVTLKVNLHSFVKWECHVIVMQKSLKTIKAIAFFTISLQSHNKIL